jgi:ABC-type branched-subunit amino acid transport system substrate-binding protein
MAVERMAVRIFLLNVALCSGWWLAACQQSSDSHQDAETLFQRGVAMYDLGQYREAADQFARVSNAFPRSVRGTAALIMQAKARYWTGDNVESGRLARVLLATAPSSAYVADAHYLLGCIYRRIGRPEEGLQEYALAWGTLPRPTPPRLFDALCSAVDTVTLVQLSVDGVERAMKGSGPVEYHGRLLLNLAEKYVREENTRAARLALDSLLSTFPDQQGQPRVLKLLAEIAERSDVKLGVLLPLMRNEPPSAGKEIAGDINDGIEYAVEQFMRDPYQRIRVTLVTRDTERDPATASRLVRELAADPTIAGIIGPVYSSTTVTAARAAQELGIPLVTPTANANGIAATGPCIFQTNPDYETRGRAMARYAIEKRGFHRLAVLAPSNSYGKFLAEGFVDEARHLGAYIVATEWYERGKSDLSSQLRSMRRAGLRLGSDPYIAFGGKKKLGELMKLVGLGVPVKTLDSLLHRGAMVNAVTLLGPGAANKLDSIGITVVYNEVMTDSLDTPVTMIEGIYAPISSSDEIGIIGSQAVYFNLQAQILGSGEWNSLPELDANRRYTAGVIFESDSYNDTLARAYQEWATGYRARFHRQPSKNSVFGYDTADLILGALREGATTRQALARALAAVRNYQGFHSSIGLAQRRVNNCLSILRFDGQNISHIDEIRVE